MKKSIYFLFGLICIITLTIGIYTVFYNKSTNNTHTITLTKKGFVPNEVHIKPQDSIIFKTTLKEQFWPASDLHPTHEIYAEFDPQEPVEAHKTWSFTFTKVGKWNFHDHLSPWARGTIYVSKD